MPKLFGVPLNDIMGKGNNTDQIPQVLQDIFAYLNRKEALEVEGLFRVSAGVKELEAIQNAYDKGERPELVKYDAHLIAGLLKAYLIDLPQPLLTFDLYQDFVNAADATDPKARIKALVNRLPKHNEAILKCLCYFLQKVCKHSEANKMGSKNLAIVFNQILLRPKVESIELLRHAPKITTVLQMMVDHFDDIFVLSKADQKLASKGQPTSIDVLTGAETAKQKKEKKEAEQLKPEEQKLKNLKNTVDDAIEVVLERLEAMSNELNNTTSLEETIEIAKRIRTAKRVLFTQLAEG